VSSLDVITFDGPAASGKSSVAQRVAAALDVPFVSSGLLYRAATCLAARHGVASGDVVGLLTTVRAHQVQLNPDRRGDRVRIDGRDVTASLHTDEVDAEVSAVARHPEVRDWVAERLRALPPPFVIDGRDMGSVVFPDARHKFYLTATPEVRARRRVGERAAELASVAAAIRRRDELDARQLAPAPDAHHIDTGPMTLDEVVAYVLARLPARSAEASRSSR
jgi:CMP/dCMP kinase